MNQALRSVTEKNTTRVNGTLLKAEKYWLEMVKQLGSRGGDGRGMGGAQGRTNDVEISAHLLASLIQPDELH